MTGKLTTLLSFDTPICTPILYCHIYLRLRDKLLFLGLLGHSTPRGCDLLLFWCQQGLRYRAVYCYPCLFPVPFNLRRQLLVVYCSTSLHRTWTRCNVPCCSEHYLQLGPCSTVRHLHRPEWWRSVSGGCPGQLCVRTLSIQLLFRGLA